MNIFFFNADPKVCAEQHCDRHVVKMIVEYSQLLSTAHRVLDGEMKILPKVSKSGRISNRKVWQFRPDDAREEILYQATHINHPSAKWVRHSKQNYLGLLSLLKELIAEFKFRFNRTQHKSEQLIHPLSTPPENIQDVSFSPPWRAMPPEFKVPRNVNNYCQLSYQDYFNAEKQHLASWKNRNVPVWFKNEN